ncbi:hypothetical protein J6590_019330 [Homalodisca vitripennis]|nr:hypothetical protein J6590_019330 [Homalodisca vitripennis]
MFLIFFLTSNEQIICELHQLCVSGFDTVYKRRPRTVRCYTDSNPWLSQVTIFPLGCPALLSLPRQAVSQLSPVLSDVSVTPTADCYPATATTNAKLSLSRGRTDSSFSLSSKKSLINGYLILLNRETKAFLNRNILNMTIS